MKIKSKSGKICIARHIRKDVSDEELLKFFRDLNSLGWSIAGFWNKRGDYVEVTAD